MQNPSTGCPSRTVTHYEILDLQPALLSSAEAQDAAQLVKRAYRRALLRNHPDKSAVAAAQSQLAAATNRRLSGRATIYTVDQISEAFNVLSAPSKRKEYDAALRMSRVAGSGGVIGLDEDSRFQTGIENVDLDDLGFDEDKSRWYRSCRCGNDRGYSFVEDDLVEASDDGLLMVGCQDCSLWLKIHFAVLEDEK
ncbi:hypothetical protein NQ176_g10709 [Zarea fungicola]|uniref:Uncharacterized protein n=1 Tax=Zarea fungicola TaxID=93591 RepID=A0ACC1ME09_9HYPO|nr:hypothetical protein NQ176_g10709 [Lecanicillium fungicola]